MPRVRLAENDRALIVRYLGGNPDVLFRADAPTVRRDTAVAALYGLWCSSCHGATGKGDGPNAKHLPVPPARHADAKTTAQRSDDALFDTIVGGGGIMNRSPRMPAFGESLSVSEVRSLVRYIRVLCQCEGPAWSRGSVK